jgi:hypothetical protein
VYLSIRRVYIISYRLDIMSICTGNRQNMIKWSIILKVVWSSILIIKGFVKIKNQKKTLAIFKILYPQQRLSHFLKKILQSYLRCPRNVPLKTFYFSLWYWNMSRHESFYDPNWTSNYFKNDWSLSHILSITGTYWHMSSLSEIMYTRLYHKEK